MKKDQDQNIPYNIYNAIFIMYHLSLNKIMDNDFFDVVEKNITPALLNPSYITARQIYGALFSYYTFMRGKPENILWFETTLQGAPNCMHIEMSSVLFEMVFHTTTMDKERRDLFITNFFKQNFLEGWDREVKYKQRLISNMHQIFMNVNYLDEEVWDKLIRDTVNCIRICNIEFYDIMLRGLNWYHNHPQSPKFQKLSKEIESFKARITKNENRNWKYDAENNRWRTYEDLLRLREEVNENYVIALPEIKEEKEEVKKIVARKEYTLDETIEYIQKGIDKKVSAVKLKDDLVLMRVPYNMIDEAFIKVTKVNKTSKV